ncbi:MAG: reverse transcriptase domain-containing protein, partial [Marinobacter sp.]
YHELLDGLNNDAWNSDVFAPYEIEDADLQGDESDDESLKDLKERDDYIATIDPPATMADHPYVVSDDDEVAAPSPVREVPKVRRELANLRTHLDTPIYAGRTRSQTRSIAQDFAHSGASVGRENEGRNSNDDEKQDENLPELPEFSNTEDEEDTHDTETPDEADETEDADKTGEAQESGDNEEGNDEPTLTEFAQLAHNFHDSHMYGDFDPRVLVSRRELLVEAEQANVGIEEPTLGNPQDANQEFEEPTSFEGAWNHENPNERRLWREAVQKEFADMERRNVWDVIDRSEMPGDRRCVKCKWVLKIKRDGRHRARLVACGYSQIPGVDFSENFAPV